MPDIPGIAMPALAMLGAICTTHAQASAASATSAAAVTARSRGFFGSTTSRAGHGRREVGPYHRFFRTRAINSTNSSGSGRTTFRGLCRRALVRDFNAPSGADSVLLGVRAPGLLGHLPDVDPESSTSGVLVKFVCPLPSAFITKISKTPCPLSFA